MKAFIIISVLFLNCTINFTTDTVYKKELLYDSTYLYSVKEALLFNDFYGHKNMYDVGDSLNKWFKEGK